MKTYNVRVWEKRRVDFTVDAENEAEAIATAKDSYVNNDFLQDKMLEDEAIVEDGAMVLDVGKPHYTREIVMKKDDLTYWEKMLASDDIDYDAEGWSEEEAVAKWTAKFTDGKEIDVKVCTNCREDKDCWSEAVLFDSNGCQITYTEVQYDLAGPWNLETEDAIYTVTVRGE